MTNDEMKALEILGKTIQNRVARILHPEETYVGFKNLTKPEDVPFDRAVRLIMTDILEVWRDPEYAAHPEAFEDESESF